MQKDVLMKVSELKPGMLLRFKEPRIYKFLRDSGDDHWLDISAPHKNQTLKWVQLGQPLMIYLGQNPVTMEATSMYGKSLLKEQYAGCGRMLGSMWRQYEF